MKQAILKVVPTAAQWAGIKGDDKDTFKIRGLGLIAIATRFGVTGNPIGYNKYHLELGRIIYGNLPELIYVEKVELTLEDFKKAILNKVPTAVQWAGIDREARLAFKIQGLGLRGIAGKFGIAGNPISNHKYHLELGRMIYGNLPELIDAELTLEDLKKAILNEVPTAAQWAGMDSKAKKNFKVGELGLYAIATKFCIVGNPIKNNKYYLELGRIIYGNLPELIYVEKVELTLEDLKKAILNEVPTAAQWARMNAKTKHAFKSQGLGLTAIATRFGVVGNPSNNHKYHLELGRLIYGELE